MRTSARFFTTVAVLTVLIVFGATRVVDTQTGAAGSASFTAKLVDPEKKAAKQEATVEVATTGIAMTDPASVGEKPAAGQGHLHYQVDKGPVIATTATKLSLHELTPGSHAIVVALVGNDHKPLAAEQTLTVKIPNTTR